MKDPCSVTLLVIGSELLSGLREDTNGPFLRNALTRGGIPVDRITILPDRLDVIERELRACMSTKPAVIILCGGLGPTEDDLTKKAVAAAMERDILVDEKLATELNLRLADRGHAPSTTDQRQAEIVDGAEIIPNQVGLAPGLKLVDRDTRIYLLPGPPRELKPMFEAHVLPEIMDTMVHRHMQMIRFRTAGIREADLAAAIEPIFHRHPMVSYGILPSFRTIDVVIPYDENFEIEAQLAADSIRKAIPSDIYTEDSRTLAEVVGDLLSVRDDQLGVAESCTGGMLGKLLTDVPGSSRYFLGGVIAYSDDLKVKMLHVDADILKMNGAVSEPVAIEMATGVRTVFSADWSVAITGIAGPDGGTEDKPVGTVFIGLTTPNGSTFVHRYFLGGGRHGVRLSSSHLALDMLRRRLNEREHYG